MLSKIFYTISIILTFNSVINGIQLSERNDTYHLEQERHQKIIEGLTQSLVDCHGKFEILNRSQAVCAERLLDIKSLNKELKETQADCQVKLANIKSLREELKVSQAECQDKVVNGMEFLRVEFQKFEKKLSNVEFLKAELNRLKKHKNIRNCAEVESSGIYDIVIPSFSSDSFTVVCDMENRNGGWTIFLRRMDGSVNFYRNWLSYKTGFGNFDGEFFLGLDKLHALTKERPQEMLVVLEDYEGDRRFEFYEDFAIGDENDKYILHTLGRASGTAGDSLRAQFRQKFTTYDRDNDIWLEGNCASDNLGAWWYHACQESHLTGIYNTQIWAKGVNWLLFRERHYSHKIALMMIRPKK